MLAEQLRELDEYWRRDVRLVPALRPGLDPEHVRATLISAGMEPHPDAVAWFSWHDGMDRSTWSDGPTAGASSLSALALEDALSWCADIMGDEAGEHFNVAGGPFWESGWLPLFMLVGPGLGIGIDCDPRSSNPGRIVRGVDPYSVLEDPTLFDDLGTLVSRWLHFYREGLYFLAEGSWTRDADLLIPDLKDRSIY